jgi:glutathione S-transferase
MKLYYKPGACSLASHIVIREAGLASALELVDTKAGKTRSGADFKTINPKGYVPALELDDGQVLTEGAAILPYLADRNPDAGLAPPAGTLDRTRLLEWLVYIATELHKGAYNPLFNPKAPDDWKQLLREALATKLDFVTRELDGRPYLLGARFSVADAYLFVVLRWSPRVGVDLGRWPLLAAYLERVGARPAVTSALAAERTGTDSTAGPPPPATGRSTPG